MLLDAPTLAAVAALGLGAAVIGGLGGFGTGVILAAALAPLIGVKALVPVLAVAGVIINAGRFWFYRAHVDRAALAVMLAAALPLLVLGAWLYSVLDARVIGTILGLAVMGSVPLRRLLRRRAVVLRTPGLAAGAAVLATDALSTIVLDLCKAALFQRFDLLDAEAAATGAAIGLATLPGSALAAWLSTRIGAKLHVLFMEALILLGGASMLWHAWR